MSKLFAAALLALMAALMWHSAVQESQTYDEATHLGSGYSYWRTGSFRLNPEHPPLSKLLQSAPLLALNPTLPVTSEPYQKGYGLETGVLFVHHNHIPAATLLGWGRAVTILLTLALGAFLFYWTRGQSTTLAALIALTLFALDPNFLAHGHYITSDVPAALTIFAAALAWLACLHRESPRYLWLAGLTLGLALATKFSALFLVPVHLAIGLALAPRLRTLKQFLAVTFITVAVIAVAYGPATPRAFLVNPRKPLATLRDNHPYAIGVKTLLQHNADQQPAYLLGQKYRGGRWQYFPVAFLVKTPAASLIAFLFLIPLFLRREARRQYWPLLVYPAVYFAITMSADLNIGLRHILPVYPFLYALAGIALAQLTAARTRILALLAAAATFETARIHPDHIAFFNLFSGGPDNGPNLLLDSNLDWGQDLLRLKSYLAAHGTDTVAIQYFGGPTPADYGIREQGLPGVWDKQGIANIDSFAAISLTNLYDVYFEKPTYTWLLAKQPTAKIGRGIYLYDLRKNH